MEGYVESDSIAKKKGGAMEKYGEQARHRKSEVGNARRSKKKEREEKLCLQYKFRQ